MLTLGSFARIHPIAVRTTGYFCPLLSAALSLGQRGTGRIAAISAAAQGPRAYAYAYICEHCPNFRNDPGFLPILAAQRADAETLAAGAPLRLPAPPPADRIRD